MSHFGTLLRPARRALALRTPVWLENVKGILDRLQRRVPGERQIGLTPVVAGLQQRLDRKVLEHRVREPRQPMFSDKTRQLSPGARPEPNAPQLIRLVRTPFELSVGHTSRENLVEPRVALAPPPRVDAAIREALGARVHPSFPSPAQSRPLLQAPLRRAWRSVEED